MKHIVYMSLARAGDHVALAIGHRRTERLRNGLYAELAFPGAAEAAMTGAYTAPVSGGRWAAVAREDLADVAATVVAEADRHRGKVCELVGDRALSGQDIAGAVAGVVGRPVDYRPGTLEQLRASLTAAGLPAWQVPTVVSS